MTIGLPDATCNDRQEKDNALSTEVSEGQGYVADKFDTGSKQLFKRGCHVANELLLLCDAFASVQHPEQLDGLLNQKIKDILPIQSSFILYIKEGNSGYQYTLYPAPADLPQDHGHYYTIQKEENKLLLNLLNSIHSENRNVHLDLNVKKEETEKEACIKAFALPGISSLIVTGLFSGTQKIGYWLVLTETGNFQPSSPSGLFDFVTGQLTNTVLRIRLAGQLRTVMNESERVQHMNIALTKARNIQDILSALRTRLLSLFPFSHHFIAKVNEDGLTMTFFGSDVHSSARHHPLYEKVKTLKTAVANGVWNKVLLSEEPVIFNLKEMEQQENLPLFVRVNVESGIRWVVMLVLKADQKPIGVWGIAFTDLQQPASKQLQQMKAIAPPLSPVIAHLIDSDSMHKKSQQREKLLDVHFALVQINDRSKLLSVLDKHLHVLLGSNYHSVNFDQEIRDSSGIDITSMDSLFRSNTNDAHLAFLQAEGVHWIGKLSLKNRLQPDACLYVYFKGIEMPETTELELLHEISHAFSKAFSIVLKHEEITRREREQQLLLSQMRDIAGIRTKEPLLHSIKNLLQPTLGFSHFALAEKDADGVITTFLADPASRSKMHPSYYSLFRQELQRSNAFLQHIHHASQPVVINSNNAENFSELPDVIKINFESGIEEMVITNLYDGGTICGYWFLLYQQMNPALPSHFQFINAIAKQLSAAIFSIRANTAMLSREREYDLLFDIGKMMAAAKDYNELASLIASKLPDIFLFEHHLIGLVSERGTKVKFIRPNADSAMNTTHENIFRIQDILDDDLYHSLLASNSFVEVTLTDKQIHRFQQISRERLPTQLMAAGFHHGGKLAGIWLIFFNNTQLVGAKRLQLLSTIKDQLSSSINNLVSAEQIQQQLMETSHDKEHLEEETVYLREELQTAYQHADIVGQSSAVKKLFEMVSLVAPADSTVLIQGETGTGKELIARAIHNLSPRRNKLLVKVNCAALPANLIESELFGHEKGSFTGAIERRIGKFELANGGTLFLDEIGEMPPELQVKLLRALQEREIERIGGRSVIKINVRVVTATNRNLEEEVRAGRFRSDLYFRLNTFPIYSPPLRDHKEDIPLLTNHFVNRFAKKAGKLIDAISRGAMQILMAYDWPGNVRELEHHIERSVLLTQGNTIRQRDVMLRQKYQATNVTADIATIKTIDDNERDLIIRALKFCSGKISGANGAAAILGVPPTTLYSKMKRLHIKKTFNK